MLKTCSKCQKEKLKSEFYKDSGNHCKQCHKKICVANLKANPEANRARAKKWYSRNQETGIASARNWQRKNPERDKLNKFKYNLRKRYNITYEEYMKMVAQQNGLCAICSTESYRRLEVDHNHSTGVIRSLLCSNCNTALGLLKEDPSLFAKASEYLSSHNLDK